ncbi:DUF47 family protein [Mucilaginibacter daejeonensis]|uniref:DUF47 domain-containing protein n=1 Tax=Mucilaginibacter daejeonensis TaxID=398049 RepID=UPI001D176831|nr:DUF47 family protein [Mucilaginibacter daejeonensis]UEG52018.1 DUF47 family protein [Mucilaginibacter daejeonensis]
MSSILTRFLPDNDKIFYNLFGKAAANCTQMAQLLIDAISGEWLPDQRTEFMQISRLKAQSTELKREVYAVSGKALISPFERNDMYALASALNNVSDMIDSAARRINLYSLNEITMPIKQLCDLIVRSTIELERCVHALEHITIPEPIVNSCNEIKRLEHEADMVYDKAFALLNAEETDTFQLIKYSEIYGALERTTDKCEDVAYIAESILIKNS